MSPTEPSQDAPHNWMSALGERGQAPPAFPTSTALDPLRTRLSETWSRKVLAAFSKADSPSDTLKGCLSLAEHLVQELAHLANAVYVSGASPNKRIESVLRGLTGNLSFGDYLAMLRVALTELDEACPAVFARLSREELPDSCREFVLALSTAREARGRYQIPVAGIENYVRDAMKGKNKKVTLMVFLEETIQVRNAFAHPGKGWWIESTGWYEWINGRLSLALADLLLHPPVQETILRYPCVRVLDDPRRKGTAWEVLVLPEDMGPGAMPLEPLNMRSGDRPAEVSYYADVHQQELLCPRVTLPTAKISRATHEQQYLRRFVGHLLRVGMIDEVAREELDESADDLPLTEEQRAVLEDGFQGLVSDFHASEVHGSRDEALASIKRVLGDETGGKFPDLEEQLRALRSKLVAAVFQQIEDAPLVSFKKLSQLTRQSELLLESVLKELCTNARVREIDGLGGEKLYSSALVAPLDRLAEILESVTAGRNKVSSYDPNDLLTLCYELSVAKPPDLRAAFDGLYDRAEDQPSRNEAAQLRLVLEGETIEVERAQDLFEAVYEIVGDDPRFRNSVPFLAGTTRYLVNWSPEHSNSTKFHHAHEFGDVFFEGNWERWKALIEVERFLKSCGFQVGNPDFAVATEETEDEGDGLVLPEGTGNRLGVSFCRNGEHVVIEGSSVARFFGKLLDYVALAKLLGEGHLPILAGRVRRLVAMEPVHESGSPFRTVVQATLPGEEEKTVYMEAAFSREDAAAHARDLCVELGMEQVKSFNVKDRLVVRLGEEEIEGSTVRDFVDRLTTYLDAMGFSLTELAPFSATANRHLFAASPMHPDGSEFYTAHERDGLFWEINLSYEETRRFVGRLLGGRKISFEFVTPETQLEA